MKKFIWVICFLLSAPAFALTNGMANPKDKVTAKNRNVQKNTAVSSSNSINSKSKVEPKRITLPNPFQISNPKKNTEVAKAKDKNDPLKAAEDPTEDLAASANARTERRKQLRHRQYKSGQFPAS